MAVPKGGEAATFPKDNIRVTPVTPSEGLAIGFDGAFAAAGAARIFGVTLHSGVADQNMAVAKQGLPIRLRIEPGEVLAVGDRIGVKGVAGRFGKVAAAALTGVLGTAREATTGSGTEFALCDFYSQGFSEAVS